MMIPFLISKIHEATVTGTNLKYSGSISIDKYIIDKANLREFQKVDIYNITNGQRFSTYVISGKEGSGEMTLNGAAAHLVNKGDKIIIAAYGFLEERELNSLSSILLILGEDNKIEKFVNGKL